MTLPWLLHRLGLDPAFGSGPLATVVQDLLSIVLYFVIAARSWADTQPLRHCSSEASGAGRLDGLPAFEQGMPLALLCFQQAVNNW
jgi:hypothetical protein